MGAEATRMATRAIMASCILRLAGDARRIWICCCGAALHRQAERHLYQAKPVSIAITLVAHYYCSYYHYGYLV